jgi:hypothetical protein
MEKQTAFIHVPSDTLLSLVGTVFEGTPEEQGLFRIVGGECDGLTVNYKFSEVETGWI